MTPILSFFVPGIPQTAGSKRAFVLKKNGSYTGRVAVSDANPKSKDWKAQVAHEGQLAFESIQDPNLHQMVTMDGPLEVHFTFHMPRRLGDWSHSKKYGDRLKPNAPLRPITRPDALKLARAVEDALTGVIWGDDSQIVIERLEKRYSDKPGVLVQVWQADETISP